MRGGEVGLVGVAECLACQRAGGVVVALIGCDPGPEAPAVGEVDNVFGGAGLLAFEREMRGFIGFTALVEYFREVDERRRAEACLPQFFEPGYRLAIGSDRLVEPALVVHDLRTPLRIERGVNVKSELAWDSGCPFEQVQGI